MAVFGAMISYAMQGLSFIVLRKNMPNIVRPYRSPVGVPGAFVTIVVALVTLYYQLQDPVYRGAVYYVAGFYVLGILYFAVYGRNQLILSPEEEFAHQQGREGSRLRGPCAHRARNQENRGRVAQAARPRSFVEPAMVAMAWVRHRMRPDPPDDG